VSLTVDFPAVAAAIALALQTAPFRVSGASLGSAPVSELLTAHLGADELVLDGASAGAATDTSVVVSGTIRIAVYGLALLAAEAIFSVADGTAQLQLTLTGLPAGWRPSVSFPSLRDTVSDAFQYESPALVLDSQNWPLPDDFPVSYGYPAFAPATRTALTGGLSLRATVSMLQPPAGLSVFAGLTAWTVAGEIGLLGQWAVLCLRSQPAAAPYQIAGYTLPFGLAIVVTVLQPPDGSRPASWAW
jgi:hypothetical protein